ncbi:MAG: hypothetical protein QM704_10155 [Anaeromyxobacteraceae bacterium]
MPSVLASLAAGLALAAAAPPSVVVLDVEAPPGERLDAAVLGAAFAAGLEDRDAWRLQTLHDVRAMLSVERDRQALGTCQGEGCLAALGASLDAPLVAVLSLAAQDDRLTASARVLSRETGSAVAHAAVAGDRAQAAGLARRAGEALRAAWRSARGLGAAAAAPACPDVGACDRGCRAGEAAGCARLGDLLGAGLPSDRPKAGAAWSRACNLGALEACERGARALDDAGFHEASVPAFRRACLDGASQAACRRGWELLERGEPGGRDAPAVPLLERGCAGSDREACARLAAHRWDGAPRLGPAALEPLVRACTLEPVAGCPGAAATFARVGCAGASAGACLAAGLELARRRETAGLGESLAAAACPGAAADCHRSAGALLGGDDRARRTGAWLDAIACRAGAAEACPAAD